MELPAFSAGDGITALLVARGHGRHLRIGVPRAAAGCRGRARHGRGAAARPRRVVIPARDEERNLPLLLEDLRAQDPTPAQVVVIDDHSTDRTGGTGPARRGRRPHRPPRPSGWNPKVWALSVGANHRPILHDRVPRRRRPPALRGTARHREGTRRRRRAAERGAHASQRRGGRVALCGVQRRGGRRGRTGLRPAEPRGGRVVCRGPHRGVHRGGRTRRRPGDHRGRSRPRGGLRPPGHGGDPASRPPVGDDALLSRWAASDHLGLVEEPRSRHDPHRPRRRHHRRRVDHRVGVTARPARSATLVERSVVLARGLLAPARGSPDGWAGSTSPWYRSAYRWWRRSRPCSRSARSCSPGAAAAWSGKVAGCAPTAWKCRAGPRSGPSRSHPGPAREPPPRARPARRGSLGRCVRPRRGCGSGAAALVAGLRQRGHPHPPLRGRWSVLPSPPGHQTVEGSLTRDQPPGPGAAAQQSPPRRSRRGGAAAGGDEAGGVRPPGHRRRRAAVPVVEPALACSDHDGLRCGVQCPVHRRATLQPSQDPVVAQGAGGAVGPEVALVSWLLDLAPRWHYLGVLAACIVLTLPLEVLVVRGCIDGFARWCSPSWSRRARSCCGTSPRSAPGTGRSPHATRSVSSCLGCRWKRCCSSW